MYTENKNHKVEFSTKRKIIILFAVVVLICSQLSVFAGDDKLSVIDYQSMNMSYMFGAQVYNDNFLYNPGYSFQYSVGKKINKDVYMGLGVGFMPMTAEKFIPVFLEIIGNKKNKDNAPFIRFLGGYSIGWLEDSNTEYDMQGGLYFNAGLGRKIKVSDNLSLLFHWSYCHQFAKAEYEIFGERNYTETLNYDMLQISIGLIIKQ